MNIGEFPENRDGRRTGSHGVRAAGKWNDPDRNFSGGPRREALGLCGRTRLFLACVVWIGAWGAAPVRAIPTGRELLRNGDFAKRTSSNQPTYWSPRGEGSYAHFQLIPPPPGSTETVLKVTVSRASQWPWAAQLLQNIEAPLKKGETLYLTFDYKMSPNYSFNGYWQKEAPPWPKFISFTVNGPADGEWHQCAIAVRVPENMPPRATSITLHLAAKAGTVYFRNFSLTAYPASVAPEDLATTITPVLGGDEVDKAWRRKANARLKRVRTQRLVLTVLDGGKPLAGQAVQIEQTSREFHFGVEVPVALFVPNGLSCPDFDELATALEGVRDKIGKYREVILESGLFNAAAPRRALFWRLSETPAGQLADAAVTGFVNHGLYVRGQALYCPAFRFAPPRCREMDPAALAAALKQFILKQTGRYRGRIREWDVVYAANTYDEIYGIISPKSLVSAFDYAAQGAPQALLVLRADRALSAPTRDALNNFLALYAWLVKQGANIQAIALDARMSQPYIAPSALEQRLDAVAQAGLPIIITSFEVEAPTPALQASRLQDLLTLFYSRPAVKGIMFSGIWEPEMRNPRAALFDREFREKPGAKIVEKLLQDTWRTQVAATTDADGKLRFRAFRGRYRLVVERAGKRSTASFTVGPKTREISVDVAAGKTVPASVAAPGRGERGANPP